LPFLMAHYCAAMCKRLQESCEPIKALEDDEDI
jgi:hypothetical protein